MQWLQPWSFLWAALLIPGIILLYLLKRRYTDRMVASTFLWQKVLHQMEVAHPWQRLQRHLLLLLQLLAAALLIAALARPAVSTEGVTARHTILLMDTSGSMLAQEGEMNRLEQAKKEAIRLARSIQGEQTVTIVETGDPPRVAVAETGDRRLLEQHLEQIEMRAELGDTGQALSLARALASRYEKSEVILISDGSGWEIEPHLAPDRFIAIGESKQNLSIAQVTTVQKGERVEGLARLENTGTDTLQGTLSLYDAEDHLLDAKSVEVTSGQSHVVAWQELPLSAYYRAELESDRDALAADNVYWTVPTTKMVHQALYVGEGHSFLSKALRLNDRLELVEEVDGNPERYIADQHYPLVIYHRFGDGLPQEGNGLFIHPTADFAGWNWGGKEQPQAPIEELAHPIVEHVSLQNMYVAETRELREVPTGWQTIVRSGDLPLIVAGEQDGQRHVVFTFDLQQSDLPLRPEFPVLMHQIVNWLLPQADAPLHAAQLGKATVIPVTDGSTTITVAAPSGDKTKIKAEAFGAAYTPQEIGLYEVHTEIGEQGPSYFTVSFPETGTAIVPQPNVPTQQGSGTTEAHGTETNLAEIGRWLALAAFVLLGVEWVVFARGY